MTILYLALLAGVAIAFMRWMIVKGIRRSRLEALKQRATLSELRQFDVRE